MSCPVCAYRFGHAADCPLRRLPARVRVEGMPDAKTMPPGPADDAALEHGRQLVREGRERSAGFWAMVERTARELGLVPRESDVG